MGNIVTEKDRGLTDKRDLVVQRADLVLLLRVDALQRRDLLLQLHDVPQLPRLAPLRALQAVRASSTPGCSRAQAECTLWSTQVFTCNACSTAVSVH